MTTSTRRAAIALGTVGALVVPLALVVNAAVVTPPTPRTGSLVQVGPIAENGFPTWYRDSNGLRLEGCWTTEDPLCSAPPDELPDPSKPVSFPDNFPGEHFYAMAGAEVVAGAAGTVDVIMNTEGAFAVEEVKDGDQVVFGRVRIRARDAADGTYRITHPYGIDEFVAVGGEGIDMTEDIGIAPGAFGGVLQSRIGPFLTWDTFGSTGAGAPPAGYIGDPGVEHKVKGSPYGVSANVVKVEQKAPNGNWAQIGFTDLFTIQGRLAVNGGVDVQQATYRNLPDGSQVVEVFATSEAGEAIKMQAPALGYNGISLTADSYAVQTGSSTHLAGRYYGRYKVKGSARVTGGSDATKIVVQNVGDVPVTSKTIPLTDVVTVGRADFNGTQLSVQATSSDSSAQLAVTGFGPLSGATSFTVGAPPSVITVTSSEGGTVTVPITTSGPDTQPDLPVAVVTATPTRPLLNQAVTLDASGSLDATSYEWAVTAKPANTPAITLSGAKPSFTPTRAGIYTFSVVAIGEAGRSPSQSVSVTVAGAAAVVTARGGAVQTVRRGVEVTLDGSTSIGAATYLWEQIPNIDGQVIPADQVVTLSSPTAAKPTFRMPFIALPQAPGPNNAYSATPATPLRFKLTVTGVDGVTTSTAEAAVRPQVETLGALDVRYRTRGEWRVSGTSDILAGQRVAIVMGSRLGQTNLPAATSARGVVIGYAFVDSTGAFAYVGTGPNPQATLPLVTSMITVVSSLGAQQVGGITVTG